MAEQRPFKRWFQPSADLGLLFFLFCSALAAGSGILGILTDDVPLTAAMAACAGIGLALSMSALVRRGPQALVIATIGFTGVGKTVYLTVLFDSLTASADPSIVFNPYGRETAEAVANNLNAIVAGGWPPKTEPGTTVLLRATASVRGSGPRLLRRKDYQLFFPDCAGEESEALSRDEGTKWLHRTQFFKEAVASDIVFLAVDARCAAAEPAQLAQLENNLMVSVHALIEQKTGVFGRKMRAPLALLLLKSDLLVDPSVNWTQHGIGLIRALFPRLTAMCEKNCANFCSFLVSAVGKVDESGNPTFGISPRNVSEPLLWALRTVSPSVVSERRVNPKAVPMELRDETSRDSWR